MEKIKVIVSNIGELPKYQTSQASGMDIQAFTSSTITLKPNEVQLIQTGIKMAIPRGYECQIRPRSGLSLKGITVANAPGTIDADYRGEVKVILINHGKEDFIINNGDRIAQMVFTPIVQCEWVLGSLDDTERGQGGFGSTGK